MTIQQAFSPYTDNGGTTLAIAGKDYCLVAGDTRQSEGYLIHTRYAPKVYELSNRSVLATSGMYADGTALVKLLENRCEWYQFNHEKAMSTQALAQMLSSTLYSKRFFPFYVFNILCGLDESGQGCVYSYDPVGSFERESCRAGGSASHLIQPFLDNQINKKNQSNVGVVDVPLEDAIRIAKDAFSSATERDIYTGDYLELFIIRKTGVEKQIYDLKKD